MVNNLHTPEGMGRWKHTALLIVATMIRRHIERGWAYPVPVEHWKGAQGCFRKAGARYIRLRHSEERFAVIATAPVPGYDVPEIDRLGLACLAYATIGAAPAGHWPFLFGNKDFTPQEGTRLQPVYASERGVQEWIVNTVVPELRARTAAVGRTAVEWFVPSPEAPVEPPDPDWPLSEDHTCLLCNDRPTGIAAFRDRGTGDRIVAALCPACKEALGRDDPWARHLCRLLTRRVAQGAAAARARGSDLVVMRPRPGHEADLDAAIEQCCVKGQAPP
jgi:hypothetical protein